jgi:3-hydroxyisobutyrate dehydrogenase-like beta-hydroxyacid dehydrogenase
LKTHRIGIVGLGELGNAVTEDLLNKTRHRVRIWDWRFDDVASSAAINLKTLRQNSRVDAADSAGSALESCDIVISAVTADQAVACAASVALSLEAYTYYVDVNSISPQSKRQVKDIVERSKGRFVEAAVMSPILPLRSDAPILLGGPHAHDFLEVAKMLPFTNLNVVSLEWGIASATKMCRSVVVKGIEALVAESLLSARRYGVEGAVINSLSNLFPRDDWESYATYLISRSLQHGARRASEMKEAAKTVAEVGLNPLMSLATADRQAWAQQHCPRAMPGALSDLLDEINLNAAMSGDGVKR